MDRMKNYHGTKDMLKPQARVNDSSRFNSNMELFQSLDSSMSSKQSNNGAESISTGDDNTSIVRPIAVGGRHRRSISLPVSTFSSIDTSSSCGANRDDTSSNKKQHHPLQISQVSTNGSSVREQNHEVHCQSSSLNSFDIHSGAQSGFSSIPKPAGRLSIQRQSSNGEDAELSFLYSHRKQPSYFQNSGRSISVSPFEPLTKDRNYLNNKSNVLNSHPLPSKYQAMHNCSQFSSNEQSKTSQFSGTSRGGKISPLPRSEYEAWTKRREQELKTIMMNDPGQFSQFRPVTISPPLGTESETAIHSSITSQRHDIMGYRASNVGDQNLREENDLLKQRIAQLEAMLEKSVSFHNNSTLSHKEDSRKRSRLD